MKKLSKKDKKEMLQFAAMVLISLVITISLVLISVASDKKCNENHSAEFCRQQ